MAKTLDQLEDEFDAISDLTREAYNAVYGSGSGRGFKGAGNSLDQKYKIALEDYRKNPDATNKEILNAVEVEWKRRSAEYKRVQEQKNSLRKELNAAKKEEEKRKRKEAETKLVLSGYNNALEKLSAAEIEIGTYQGEDKYIAAYQEAQAAYDTAVAAGANPKMLPPKKIVVPDVEKEKTTEEGKGKEDKTVEPLNMDQFRNTLADPKNQTLLIEVQKDLIKNFGYKGNADGKYSLDLQIALDNAASKMDMIPSILKQGMDFRTFLKNPPIDFSKQGAGALPAGTVELSTASEAAATVESVFQSELGRLPTKKEAREYSKLLMQEERKFSSVSRPIKKIINGVEVTQNVGGIERTQILQDLVRKLPEYKESKQAARNLSIDQLQQTALANGLDLNKNFGADVVQGWAKRIQNGESIDIFRNLIRQAATTGLPENIKKMVGSGVNLDAVFSPYRKTMAAILEIPENTISLDDPTLRSAIGPDKEMSLYEFQRQLRKDPRWQYTDQARETVSSAALGILRDFGFQG